MTNFAKLSWGAIDRILAGEKPEKPLFQAMQFKNTGSGKSERMAMTIYDGTRFYHHALLAPELFHMYDEGKLDKFTVVQFEKYDFCDQSDLGVVIVQQLRVIAEGVKVARYLPSY